MPRKKNEKSELLYEIPEGSFAYRLNSIIPEEKVLPFANQVGIGEASIRQYLKGSIPSMDKVVQIARVANVSLEWLATGYGSPTPSGIPSLREADAKRIKDGSFFELSPEEKALYEEANGIGIQPVPLVNVAASAGHGALVYDESQVEIVSFSRPWLYQNGLSPNDIFVMPTIGESMEPTIHSGDLLLCSQAEHHKKAGDGVYVVRLDGNILVKRTQVLPGKKSKCRAIIRASSVPMKLT